MRAAEAPARNMTLWNNLLAASVQTGGFSFPLVFQFCNPLGLEDASPVPFPPQKDAGQV